MIAVGILGFLVGAVMAWGFRVWILIPVTLAAFLPALILELTMGSGWLAAIGTSLAIGVAPQLGYAFGLVARTVLANLRSPRKARTEPLAKHRSMKAARAE